MNGTLRHDVGDPEGAPLAVAPSILVIAMTRMGDLFQLAPMVSALRSRRPGCRIALVAYREFGETASGLDLFDALFLVDGQAIRGMVYNDQVSWVAKIHRIREMTGDFGGEEFDLLINLTPNRIGTVLGYLVRAKEVRGLVMTRDGFRAFFDPGIAFFGMMVQNRIYNDTNLVDLFLRIGQVPPPDRKSRAKSPGTTPGGACLLPAGRHWVAVQTGASVAIKRWPEGAFVRMISHLLSRAPEIGVLLIGAGEEDLFRNRRIMAALEDRHHAGRLLDLTGKTSVMELSSVLREVSLLVSNDTGAMHVAASVGTPVVALSFANLFYPETAPYGDDHVVLQTRKACAPCGIDAHCTNPLCRDDVDPEWLARFVAAVEDGRRAGKPRREAMLEFLAGDPPGPQLLVALSGWDARGKLRYRPLTRYPLTVPDLFRALYRQIWAFEEGGTLDWAVESDLLRADFDVTVLDRSLWEELRIRHLELGGLFREGASLCERIRDGVEEGVSGEEELRLLAGETRTLDRIDLLIQEAGWAAPTAGPITTLFEIEKEGVAIEDPLRLLEMIQGVEEVYRRSLLRNERLIRLADRWFAADRAPAPVIQTGQETRSARPDGTSPSDSVRTQGAVRPKKKGGKTWKTVP